MSNRPDEHNLQTPLGAVVKAWREFRGWSLTEFAERAGLQKGYVSELENGKISTPRRATLTKLAEALGVTVWDLHTRQVPPSQPPAIQMSASPTNASWPTPEAGILPSPLLTPQDNVTIRQPSLGDRVDQKVAESGLPYARRKRAERMILEMVETICRVIRDDDA